MTNIETTITLNTGVQIPQFGLGVYRAGSGPGTRDAVRWALDAGYRHFDTASAYGNEEEVGAAVREYGIERSEVFVTTKLFNNDHGYDAARRAFDRSLGRLGLDYIDLYLIHWPVEGERMNSWRALEEIVSSGRCRAIGVSNYMERHLTEVYERSGVWPAVNQFELHPFLQQPELVEFHREHGIAIEAYCPVVRAQRADDPVVEAVASEVGKTWAQVMIRWSLQRGFICIPKSSNPDRIRQNADVFDFALSDEQMARIDALDEGYRIAWNPEGVP